MCTDFQDVVEEGRYRSHFKYTTLILQYFYILFTSLHVQWETKSRKIRNGITDSLLIYQSVKSTYRCSLQIFTFHDSLLFCPLLLFINTMYIFKCFIISNKAPHTTSKF